MVLRIPVLEYHDLGREDQKGRSFHSPYVLDVGVFKKHLQWLKTNQFQAMTLDDLHAGVVPARACLMTFDDGHISNLELAFPLLLEYGFPATFFLVADRVGTPNHLDPGQIRQMQAAGMAFGSHSVSHPYLPLLDSGDLVHELEGSKDRIETILGEPCLDFCIPHGFFNQRVLNHVRQAGYRTVLTEKMAYHIPNAAAFKILPRFTIKAGTSQEYFENIMLGRRLKMARRYFQEGILETAKFALGCRGYLRLKSRILREDY